MKIVAIRIRNIASLAGDHEIDFSSEPLLSTGLFAITGPTGSGKSTILDAITIALYGRTPRISGNGGEEISGVKENSINSLLRKGTGEGYVEVEFVAIDGLRYRSRLSLRRARSNPNGNFQKNELRVDNLSDNSQLQGTKTELEERLVELLGLTYDQFTRTVLLAQGDFANFLRAKDNEKTEILEKIAGSDIYTRISKAIYIRHKNLSDEVKGIQSELNRINLMNPEALEACNQNMQTVSERLQAITEKLKLIDSKRLWWSEEQQLLERLKDSTRKIAENAEDLEFNEQKRTIIELYDAIEPLRQMTQGLEKSTIELEELTVDLKRRQQGVTQSQKQIEVQKGEHSLAVKAKSDEEEKQQAEEPQLKRAIELDLSLEEASKSLESLLKEKNEQEVLAQQEEKKTNEVMKEINALVVERNEHAAWFVAERRFESLVVNAEDTIGRLTTLQRVQMEFAEVTQKLPKLKKSKEEAEKQLHDFVETQKRDNLILESRKQELEALTKASEENDLPRLQQAYETLQNKGRGVEKLQVQLLQLTKLQAEVGSLSTQIKADEATQQRLTQELPQQEEVARQASHSFVLANELVARAQQSASETAQELRSALLPNQECPVCGSKDHPLAHQSKSEVALFVAKLKQEAEDASKKRDSMRQLSQKSELLLEQVAKSLLKLREDHYRVVNSVKQAEEEYQSAAMLLFGERFNSVVLSDEVTAIASQEVAAKVRYQSAYQLSQALQERTRALTKLQEHQMEQSNRCSYLQAGLTDASNMLRTQDELCKQLEVSKRQQEVQLQTLFVGFSSSEWVAPTFGALLQSRAKEWLSRQERLKHVEEKCNGLVREEALLNQKVEQLNDSLKRLVEKLQGGMEQLKSLREERSLLFEGVSLSVIQALRPKRVSELQANEQLLLSRVQELQQKLSSEEGALEELSKRQVNVAAELEQVKDASAMWVMEYNRTAKISINPFLLTILSRLTADEVKEIKSVLKEVDDQCVKLHEELKHRNEELENHRLKQHRPDEGTEQLVQLNELTTGLAAEQREKEGERLTLATALKIYKEDEERSKKLQEQIETIAPDLTSWAELNTLFGSAQGDAFRTIAMGYILEQLLQFANLHLARIHDRYRLDRIPNSLQLMVVDRYMMDVRRSAASLSGGETFIVSLALALGLSSLASDRIQIETLFIDEGFGALDPQTLAMAMEALNSLQDEGRKVGVISHIRELTEQIPTQVLVERKSNGASSVCVVCK